MAQKRKKPFDVAIEHGYVTIAGSGLHETVWQNYCKEHALIRIQVKEAGAVAFIEFWKPSPFPFTATEKQDTLMVKSLFYANIQFWNWYARSDYIDVGKAHEAAHDLVAFYEAAHKKGTHAHG